MIVLEDYRSTWGRQNIPGGGNLWGERSAGFQQPQQQGQAQGAPLITLKLSNLHSRTRQTNPDKYSLPSHSIFKVVY